jgi:hypothetical protein
MSHPSTIDPLLLLTIGSANGTIHQAETQTTGGISAASRFLNHLRTDVERDSASPDNSFASWSK